jgi:predicted DNA-binding protein with PD1-like motif
MQIKTGGNFMKVVKAPIGNLVLIRLNPGDDMLAGLQQAVKENNVKNAVILAGVGSVTTHHYHVVGSSVNPPENLFVKGEAPADVVNINGAVIDGRIHAHIIFSDTGKAYGGHLESGVKVLTFAIITMAEVDASFDKWDTVGAIESLL